MTRWDMKALAFARLLRWPRTAWKGPRGMRRRPRGTSPAVPGLPRHGTSPPAPAPSRDVPPLGPSVCLLASIDFVIVDVETTGWLPEQAVITEIGAVRLSGGKMTAEFSALVNPGGPIPADITALTGITDEMVGQAPPMGTVLPRFLAFAEGCVLAAHNAPFDIGFLTAACCSSRIPWPAFPVIDTAVLARLVLGAGDVPDCKLATLATYFAARTQPCHRALADAKATADVLQGLLRLLAEAGGRTLTEISA